MYSDIQDSVTIYNVIMFALFLQTGTTALFFAAQGGYMDIASLLLEHGAIVDSCSIVSERQQRVNEISRCSLNTNLFHVDFRTGARRCSSHVNMVI